MLGDVQREFDSWFVVGESLRIEEHYKTLLRTTTTILLIYSLISVYQLNGFFFFFFKKVDYTLD
jgi:hypothetical protein